MQKHPDPGIQAAIEVVKKWEECIASNESVHSSAVFGLILADLRALPPQQPDPGIQVAIKVVKQQAKAYLADPGECPEIDREEAVIGRYLRDILLPHLRALDQTQKESA